MGFLFEMGTSSSDFNQSICDDDDNDDDDDKEEHSSLLQLYLHTFLFSQVNYYKRPSCF